MIEKLFLYFLENFSVILFRNFSVIIAALSQNLNALLVEIFDNFPIAESLKFGDGLLYQSDRLFFQFSATIVGDHCPLIG